MKCIKQCELSTKGLQIRNMKRGDSEASFEVTYNADVTGLAPRKDEQ